VNLTGKPAGPARLGPYRIASLLALILPITLIAYWPAFQNTFTNWDDPVYVTENPLIRELSAENIRTILSPNTDVSLNYHPLTVLSLAVNYHFSGLEARSYVVTNVLLHLLNVCLVFFLVFRLTDRNAWLAAAVSLWFGVHPMHVESVAWVSERKDVLYSSFFLAGLIAYLKHVEKPSTTRRVVSFALFALSCLSKAMAVVFPVILLLVDYLRKRPLSKTAVLEKIPFVLLSLVVGFHAIAVQSKAPLYDVAAFTPVQRFVFASSGFVTYLFKLLVPVRLSAFYPYPALEAAGDVPFPFHLAPFAALAVVIGPAFLFRRFKRELLPMFLFGMGFYVATIAPVLQLIPVGSAIVADRYTYLSYTGPLLLLASLCHEALKGRGRSFVYVAAATSLVLAYLTRERVAVWRNSETLWTDVIAKYPNRALVAYKNRGSELARQNRIEEAYADHLAAVNMGGRDPGVYTNFANLCCLRGEFDRSLWAYAKALELEMGNESDIYLNRAIAYSKMGLLDRALADFDTAGALDPENERLRQTRAFVYFQAGRFDKAIADYDFLIGLQPREKSHYFNRGLAKVNAGRSEDAIADFTRCVELDPNHKEAYFNLAVVNYDLQRYREALAWAQKAKAAGYPVPEEDMEALARKIE
jgi:tetratricopeptide (TPR) repeat protein